MNVSTNKDSFNKGHISMLPHTGNAFLTSEKVSKVDKWLLPLLRHTRTWNGPWPDVALVLSGPATSSDNPATVCSAWS